MVLLGLWLMGNTAEGGNGQQNPPSVMLPCKTCVPYTMLTTSALTLSLTPERLWSTDLASTASQKDALSAALLETGKQSQTQGLGYMVAFLSAFRFLL